MGTLISTVGRLVPKNYKEKIARARGLLHLASYDFRRDVIAKWLPLKPSAISFMANDICNSRCKMCLIWEKKKDEEITSDQLAQIMRDPLFANVTDVGVTGGEPTLRKDLPELYRAIIENGKSLKGMSIITNGIQQKRVIEQVLACEAVCREHNIGFSVMLSLDGLGETHDKNRGRDGNFVSTVACFERFQSENIPVSFGCTITKVNVAEVDELLDYVQEMGWYGRFRVAEFIQRLYNDSKNDVIRAFSPREAYHLALFFYRAEHTYETDESYRKTYRSIRGMLGEGKGRTTGCAYHHDTVILTSRGDLHYCSPKSPNIGNILKKGSASDVFFGNLDKRQDLINNECDDCIHDYHVPPKFLEKVDFYLESRRRAKCYSLTTLNKEAAQVSSGEHLEEVPSSEAVLIVGWYGTETAGDKAILWDIIRRLNDRVDKPKRIIVSSLHPFITQYTIHEMGLTNVEYVETYTPQFENVCEACDEVIVGGGPLMSLDALDHMLYAIIACRKNGGIVAIGGCGIGPLEGEPYTETVRQMLRLANKVELRDHTSVVRAKSEFNINAFEVSDPATGYVLANRDIAKSGTVQCNDLNVDYDVACFLRELTFEYSNGLSCNQEVSRKDLVEQSEFELVRDLATRGYRVRFFAMHTFEVGGDDRVLARRICNQIQKECDPEVASRVSYAKLPMSPLELLAAMTKAKTCLTMRFHSVLFAEKMGLRYIAIDYTSGGKIKNFLEKVDREDRLYTLEQLINGDVLEPLCLSIEEA